MIASGTYHGATANKIRPTMIPAIAHLAWGVIDDSIHPGWTLRPGAFLARRPTRVLPVIIGTASKPARFHLGTSGAGRPLWRRAPCWWRTILEGPHGDSDARRAGGQRTAQHRPARPAHRHAAGPAGPAGAGVQRTVRPDQAAGAQPDRGGAGRVRPGGAGGG